jgi:dTDP-4-dehydrorhamnose 3,5-epimerase
MKKPFEISKSKLNGVYCIRPFISSDERGSFVKDYSQEVFNSWGIEHELKEVFYTKSVKGVIRALHFQRVKEQAKLIRCIAGKIFDVVVDLRFESETLGKWESFYLTGDNCESVLIPQGFGHGYLVLEESIVSYKCAEKFYGEYDDGIIWNDPQLAISWPLHLIDSIILSDRDMGLQSFSSYKKIQEKKDQV